MFSLDGLFLTLKEKLKGYNVVNEMNYNDITTPTIVVELTSTEEKSADNICWKREQDVRIKVFVKEIKDYDKIIKIINNTGIRYKLLTNYDYGNGIRCYILETTTYE